MSAALLGLLGSTLGGHIMSLVPVAEAQSGSVVLRPRGSEWGYHYNNHWPSHSTGRAPVTTNACVGPAGTEWWSSGQYIDMYASFYVEGPPQNVKVRVRAAATDTTGSAQSNVIVGINGSNLTPVIQPYNECDSDNPWNAEISVSSSLLVNGLNKIHVKMGTPFNIPTPTATRRAIDVEIVADSVAPPAPNTSFGMMPYAQGFSADPVTTQNGNFTYGWSDILIPGRGGGVSFSRAYNSLESRAIVRQARDSGQPSSHVSNLD